MNQLWKDHIQLDFKYSSGYARALLESENPQSIFEEFGQIPNLDDILAQNWKKLDKERLKAGAYQIVPMTAPFLSTGCYLGVRYFPEGVREIGTKGTTRFSEKTDFRDGKWEGVTISVSIEGPDVYRDFCTAMSHELLHLYDYSKRYSQIAKGKSQEDVDFRPSYSDIQALIDSPDKVKHIIGSIAYILYPGERNAFLSQMKQELQNQEDKLNTPENCQKAIEGTTYYKYLQMVKKWLRELSRVTSEETKEKVLQSVNLAVGGNYTTYNKALKRIAADADKAEKKLQSIAGKLCYSIYSSYILEGSKKRGFPTLLVDPKIDLSLSLYE